MNRACEPDKELGLRVGGEGRVDLESGGGAAISRHDTGSTEQTKLLN